MLPAKRSLMKVLCASALLLPVSLPFTAASLGAEEDDTSTRGTRGGGGGVAEFDARRKLRAAEQLIEMKEFDRAVGALENLLEQYPESKVRFKVYLALGRHFLKNKQDQKKAIEYLKEVKSIENTVDKEAGEKLQGDDLDVLLESLYLTGVAYFDMKQYDQCFPILRKITTSYPNTVWSNQSYYYIGMAHFVQKNWGKAIKYLSLVGTYIDPESETAKYVEAGHRLYIKVSDGDLPILQRLNKNESVKVMTKNGDTAELQLYPLSLRENLFIATVPTEVGEVVEGDNVLQVIGGDEITVKYFDGNTETGDTNVLREHSVEVVSTGTATFTDATYEGKAKSAYTGHPLDVLVVDVDQDVGKDQQVITVKVQARYISANDGSDEDVDYLAGGEAASEDEEGGTRWEVRDEVEIELSELANEEGGEIFHTGRFVGRVQVSELKEGAQPVPGDLVLSSRQKDQLVVTYVDEMHVNGDFERIVQDTIEVIGPWKSRLEQTNNRITDPVIASRKAVSEGEAYLALAEIFKSMGLMDGATQNVQEGLIRANSVIGKEEDISEEVRQRGFKLRWELYLAIDDLQNAIITCQLFNAAFPESRFADEALLGIGKIHLEQESYEEAIKVFQQILSLTESDAKPEAQFRIAEATEKQADALEPAIPAYQLVADRYPESLYTGEALAKLVTYHIESRDFVTANNLLTIIFEEHPDKKWLDGMLVRWVILAYRMEDYDLAYDKAQQLLFEYPDSAYAPKVAAMLKKIEKKRAANSPAAADEGAN